MFYNDPDSGIIIFSCTQILQCLRDEVSDISYYIISSINFQLGLITPNKFLMRCEKGAHMIYRIMHK